MKNARKYLQNTPQETPSTTCTCLTQTGAGWCLVFSGPCFAWFYKHFWCPRCVSRCARDSRGKGDGCAIPRALKQHCSAAVFALSHGIEYFSTSSLAARHFCLSTVLRTVDSVQSHLAVKPRARFVRCTASSRRWSSRALGLFLQQDRQYAAAIAVLSDLAHEVERRRRCREEASDLLRRMIASAQQKVAL